MVILERLPCTLESVRGAFASHVHGASEALRPLGARPQLVELVGDVGEHDLLRPGLARVLARLPRGHVAALAAALGPRKRPLDEEQVAVAREVDQVVGRAAVRAEHELLVGVLRRDGDRERLREVRDELEGERERADARGGVRLVLLEGEGVLDQVLVAPRADDPAVGLARPPGRDEARAGRAVDAGPAVDGYRLLPRRVREGVAERDEVEEVVGVEMADDDCVDLRVVTEAAQLREDAVPAVEHDRGVALLDHVARAGSPSVLPGRRLPQDGQAHSGAMLTAGLPPRASVGRASYQRPCGAGKAYAAVVRSIRKTNSSWRSGRRPREAGRYVGQGASRFNAHNPCCMK